MRAYFQAPINEQFEDSYGQRGLQPSTGRISPIRNIKTEQKNDPSIRRGGDQKKMRGTATAMKATGASMQVAGKTAKVTGGVAMRAGAALSSTGVGAVIGAPLEVVGGLTRAGGTVLDTAGKSTGRVGKMLDKKARAKKALAVAGLASEKARVTRLNLTIWSVGTSLWLIFQLKFALISLAMFGLTAAYYEISATISRGIAKVEESSIVVKGFINGVEWVVGGAIKLFTAVTNIFFELFSIDISLFLPENLFLLTYVLLLGFALFQLFVIYLVYKLAFLNPLGGKGAGLKIGAFILAIVGYSIPFLNIFPWFMVWTFAVWWKPK